MVSSSCLYGGIDSRILYAPPDRYHFLRLFALAPFVYPFESTHSEQTAQSIESLRFGKTAKREDLFNRHNAVYSRNDECLFRIEIDGLIEQERICCGGKLAS